jgi:hypothetical protein
MTNLHFQMIVSLSFKHIKIKMSQKKYFCLNACSHIVYHITYCWQLLQQFNYFFYIESLNETSGNHAQIQTKLVNAKLPIVDFLKVQINDLIIKI